MTVRCHVRQGQLDLIERLEGSTDEPTGPDGVLRSIIWFCMDPLRGMCAEGAALNHKTLRSSHVS